MKKNMIFFALCLAVFLIFEWRELVLASDYNMAISRINDNGFVETYNFHVSTSDDSPVYIFKYWTYGASDYSLGIFSVSPSLDCSSGTPSFPLEFYYSTVIKWDYGGGYVLQSGLFDPSSLPEGYSGRFIALSNDGNRSFNFDRYIEIPPPTDNDLTPYGKMVLFATTGQTFDMNFDHWSGDLHDSSLGFLKNLKLHNLVVQDTPPTAESDGTFTYFQRFTYDSRSTTGLNLKSSTYGTLINVYASYCYYKNKDNTLFLESPHVFIGSYDPTPLQFTWDLNWFLDTFESGLLDVGFKKYSGLQELRHGVYGRTVLYIQLSDRVLGSGDYLRIILNGNDTGIIESVSPSGEVISPEDGGVSGSFDPSMGFTDFGGDVDSAFDNSKDYMPGSFDDITSSIEIAVSTGRSMLELLGNVPTVFGRIFIFLPSWCRDYVSIFFVALGVLIIYKLIRG